MSSALAFTANRKHSNETTPLVTTLPQGPISVDGDDDDDANGIDNDQNGDAVAVDDDEKRRRAANFVKMVSALGLALLIVLIAGTCSYLARERPRPSTNHNTNGPTLPMPAGVNFGSWLSLEDYFFAGPAAAVEVATPWNHSQAQCLPPLLPAQSWQSETDLLASLIQSQRGGIVAALQIFHAHRLTFFDWTVDLARLSRLGIAHVRVPLSWCFTDLDPDVDGITERNAEQYVCRDPFMEGALLWPAVPKRLVQNFLRESARHQIRVTLDVHTYPGATSLGTFSGLWPRWPQFWKYDDPQASPASADVGRRLWMEFVEWMESLIDTDPLAFQGLHAVSPMNEPAHLAGLFDPDKDPQAFLPPLPPLLARQFLSELQSPSQQHHLSSSSSLYRSTTTVPDGPHLRVMLWLRDAVATFRASRLVAHGKHIHVNIHESVLRIPPPSTNHNNNPWKNSSSSSSTHDPETVALHIIAAWWRGITEATERSTWAVLDVHHYHAWEASCQGSVVPGEGNYTCGSSTDDGGAMEATLQRCTAWADNFRRIVTEECGTTQVQLVSAEFSVATHHQVRHACNDVTTLQAWYVAQVEAARKANIDLYYWSYHMPYGGAFRSAWSFRQLLYLLQQHDSDGEEAQPDEPQFPCGDVSQSLLGHVPTDDTFAP